VLVQAVTKVRKGGVIFVAQPHADSVNFPHRKGTLNFYDDPTHVTVFQPGEVATILASNGCEILKTGRTRMARNLMLMPLKMMVFGVFDQGTGRAFRDLYGFEEYTIGRRETATSSLG